MKAIILSAGQGKRLLPLTESMPKCSLPVKGESILGWQLSQIAQCDIDEVVVVTGFKADAVEAIAARNWSVKVRTSHNPFYAKCDNLGTCWVVRQEMDGPFVIINGDTLFEAAIMQRLLASTSGFPITLAVDNKSAYDDDDMKIVRRGDQLQRVGKQLDRAVVNGESIGMMVFDEVGAAVFKGKIEHLMRHDQGMARWYLSAIDELAQDERVGVCSIHGLSWGEVDDHVDLQKAQEVVSQWSTSSTVDQVAGSGNS